MNEPARPFLPPDPKGQFRYEVNVFLVNLMVAVGRTRDIEIDKALKPTGLSVTRFRTLMVISRLPDCTMSELATISTMDRTGLTRTIDQLIREGLVVRRTEPDDRRKVRISLSPAGAAALVEAQPIVDAVNALSLEGLSDEERRVMLHGMQLMMYNLRPDETNEMRRILGVPPVTEAWPSADPQP